jgi:NAD(P)-dependent dehydrogenase (short-subunit alcohol dehydrogenase family)
MGRMVALRLREEGAKVVLNGRRREKLEKVASEMGGDALVVAADVGVEEDAKKMVSETVRVFGRVDILVNCAGIALLNTVLNTSEEDWDEIFRINTKGVFLCCKEVAPYMIQQGSGKIINIASISGKLPATLMAAYCASKAAVILFTQSLALELAEHKINVNAICPGGTDETEMREYVDRRYKELADNVPDWMINGQAINVDGGVCFT